MHASIRKPWNVFIYENKAHRLEYLTRLHFFSNWNLEQHLICSLFNHCEIPQCLSHLQCIAVLCVNVLNDRTVLLWIAKISIEYIILYDFSLCYDSLGHAIYRRYFTFNDMVVLSTIMINFTFTLSKHFTIKFNIHFLFTSRWVQHSYDEQCLVCINFHCEFL